MAAPAEEAGPPCGEEALKPQPPPAERAAAELSTAQRRNLTLLCAAWACSFSMLAAAVAALSVAARAVAPSARLATLPVALILFATAVANLPVAAALARFGRSRTFVACALVGAGGAGGAAAAIVGRSFWGLCVSACAMAVGNAAAQQYRFAAADLVPAERKAMAISAVLSGGVIGAVIGPEYAKRAALALPASPYAGVFIVGAGVGFLNAALVALVRFPHEERRAAAWPAPRELASPPARTAACAVAAMCWFSMTFLMTPVPLAMLAEGFQFNDASLVVQMHMLAMYLPSFATGRVVSAIGPTRAAALGSLLVGASCAVFAGGTGLAHYMAGELLVGGGWNLQFVGATAAFSATGGGPSAAAANDFVVFCVAGAGSLSGAPALRALGWTRGHQAVAGGVTAAILSLLGVQALAERRGAARESREAAAAVAAADRTLLDA